MDKLIKKELEKLNITEEQAKETIFIPKVNEIKLDEGSFYFIHLPIRPAQIITYNWNNGILPTDHYYKANLIKKMNNMIYINGIACDEEKNTKDRAFNGWLDLNTIEILERL